MRRFIVAMLAAGAILSTPLAAQHSLAIGAAAILGGDSQIEGGEVLWITQVNAGPLRYASVGGRLGVFVDESQITGGTQGIATGLVLQTRTGLANVADVGNESNPSPLGFDVTFEGVLYGSANAPSEFGTVWGAVSVLPGLRIGAGPQMRYGLVFGPTLFFGNTTEVRPFLAVRVEVPMGRKSSQ